MVHRSRGLTCSPSHVGRAVGSPHVASNVRRTSGVMMPIYNGPLVWKPPLPGFTSACIPHDPRKKMLRSRVIPRRDFFLCESLVIPEQVLVCLATWGNYCVLNPGLPVTTSTRYRPLTKPFPQCRLSRILPAALRRESYQNLPVING